MARDWLGRSKDPEPPQRGGNIDPDQVEITVPKGHPTSTHDSYKIGPGDYNDGQPHSYVSCYCSSKGDHERG